MVAVMQNRPNLAHFGPNLAQILAPRRETRLIFGLNLGQILGKIWPKFRPKFSRVSRRGARLRVNFSDFSGFLG